MNSPADQQSPAQPGATTTTTITPVSISTPEDWANVQLAYMGYPDTQSNVAFLLGWYGREGGNWNNTAAFNPLNTTLVLGGKSNPMNGVGVQAYSSWGQGLQATAQTLAGYPQITQALASGDASQADQQGLLSGDLSKWSGGGYSSVSPAGPTSNTTAVLDSSTWTNIKNWVSNASGLNNVKSYDNAIKNATPGSISNPLSGISNSLSSLSNFFGLLTQKSTWIRIAQVGGGLLAVGMGFVLLGKALGFSGAVAGLAGTIAHVPGVAQTPAGRVVKATSPAPRTAPRPAPARRPAAPDADDVRYQAHRRSAAENRSAYRAKMRDTSDLRRRTA